MKKLIFNRSAFTMLELIFVIVVLGIVSSIGSELIAKVYKNYIVQRALHRSSTKTELVANQIVNRLSYAIPHTIIGRPDATVFKAINDIPLNGGYNILEWVAYDNDGFTSYTDKSLLPAWSGFIDLANSSRNVLSTLGSNLGLANTIINNLSKGAVKGLANTAVFFPSMYNETSIGYIPVTNPIAVSTVASGTGQSLKLDTLATPRIIKEHYKLAWSAYAIEPILQANGLYTLNLHYNFQPWDGSFYNTSPTQTIIRNVSVFNFIGSGTTIRFKLCIQEDIGTTTPITTCKEKVVFR